jgi:hypothetical protein
VGPRTRRRLPLARDGGRGHLADVVDEPHPRDLGRRPAARLLRRRIDEAALAPAAAAGHRASVAETAQARKLTAQPQVDKLRIVSEVALGLGVMRG